MCVVGCMCERCGLCEGEVAWEGAVGCVRLGTRGYVCVRVCVVGDLGVCAWVCVRACACVGKVGDLGVCVCVRAQVHAVEIKLGLS